MPTATATPDPPGAPLLQVTSWGSVLGTQAWVHLCPVKDNTSWVSGSPGCPQPRALDLWLTQVEWADAAGGPDSRHTPQLEAWLGDHWQHDSDCGGIGFRVQLWLYCPPSLGYDWLGGARAPAHTHRVTYRLVIYPDAAYEDTTGDWEPTCQYALAEDGCRPTAQPLAWLVYQAEAAAQ
jgi:hypothetical protein